MGGDAEKSVYAITGVCKDAVDALTEMGYIQPLQFLGGEVVESTYVITDKGRKGFNKVLRILPLDEVSKPIISDEEAE